MANLFDITQHTINTGSDKYATQFQTPPAVCEYMVSLLPKGVISVLEPTPGQGNIVAALKGYNVTAPADFFLLPPQTFDAVVMNPPFSLKYAHIENMPLGLNKYGLRLGYHILKECMQMSDVVIALMPWFTISDSDVRLRELKQYGIKSITTLPRKTFQYARIQTVVIELRKGYQKETIFKVIT